MSMPEADPKYVFQFRVRTLDKSRPVSQLVDEINGLVAQLPPDFGEYGSNLKVTVDREKQIPIDPLTAIILVEIVNITLKPFLEGFFKKLGEKMADYLSDGTDNAQIVLEKEPPPPIPKADEQSRA